MGGKNCKAGLSTEGAAQRAKTEKTLADTINLHSMVMASIAQDHLRPCAHI